VRNNVCKFGQNSFLKHKLLSTGNRLIVEASPKDAIYGIGLDERAARLILQDQWPGRNLLGNALMHAREIIRRGEEVKWY
jgi:ribA/ribD-fused uncharacterized protein